MNPPNLSCSLLYTRSESNATVNEPCANAENGNNNSGLNFNVSTELKTQYICEAYEYTKKYFEDNQQLEDDKETLEENKPSEEEDNSEEKQNSSDDKITISDTIVNSHETETD